MHATFWFFILLFVIVIFLLSNNFVYRNIAEDLKLRRERFAERQKEE